MKKKVLITGGAGTIGSAFIKNYRDEYSFSVISRNESMQHAFRMAFPEANAYMCDICHSYDYARILKLVEPDIVIHAAALKHVDVAEKQPCEAVYTNVVGSLSVVETNEEFGVPITIGISTDKACDRSNVYGMTKYLMERCFAEKNTVPHTVAVCRFGNVAFSNGSVLPFWLKLKKEGKPLKITDVRMNRMMFSQADAASLIRKTIAMCEEGHGGFVLSKQMLSVNMLRLAERISNKIEVIGIRPGEKLDEDLISSVEIPYSTVLDNGYIRLDNQINQDVNTRLSQPYNTKTGRFMNDNEIDALISSQN